MAFTPQEARGIVRKAKKRVPEGEEIRHLNIMPMMDIMTILLVAFLYQSAAAQTLAVGDVHLPPSRSFDPLPENAVVLTIATDAILVEGQPVVEVKNGDVDASEKKSGAIGLEIPKLEQFLAVVRANNDALAKAHGKKPDKLPQLVIIADKRIPYKLLFEVIVSSRAKDAGYRRFRLIVLEPGSAKKA